MAIKHTIAKLEDVEESFRLHYKPADAADSTKGFVLDVEGAPQQEDVGALKRALERVRQEKDAAIEEARKKGEDIEAVRKSYETQVKTYKEQIGEAEGKARQSFLEKTVSDLSAELGGENAALLIPHVRGRLVVEAPDGTNLVRVLGKDGKASALSLEDLKAELKSDKLFAPVIQAGRASGAGGSGGASPNGGAGGGSGSPELPKNATAAQKVEWLRQQNTPGYVPE